MENRSNFYHWPTTVWLSSSSLCSSENEARPHTEAGLQRFKQKKNTNGKSQMGFQMGGGRQCRNVLAQLLWGVCFESKAPTCSREFAWPRFCDCRAGNVHSAAECARVHQPQWESLLRAFQDRLWIDPAIYENKNEGCMEYFFFKIISASE